MDRSKTGVIYVRFTHQGRRQSISTGEKDRHKALDICARIYGDVIAGRYRGKRNPAPGPGSALERLVAAWLDDITPEVDVKTIKLFRIHFRAHLTPFFGSLLRITPQNAAEYRRARLRVVMRQTVVHELTSLRRFLAWCKEGDYLLEIPVIRGPAEASARHPGCEAKAQDSARGAVASRSGCDRSSLA